MRPLHIRLISAFLIVLILTIMPLPELLSPFRPPWLLILVLYLQFYLPDHFKVTLLVILGLVLDTLLSTVIGEHVFALCLVTWIASSKARRFHFFPIGQQMALIGFLTASYQLIILLIDAFLGYSMSWFSVLGAAILSILIWPWLRLIGEEMLLAKTRPAT